jgi:hypothetical protein
MKPVTRTVRSKLALAACGLALLAGCGSGSASPGSSPSAAAPATSSPAPASPSAAASPSSSALCADAAALRASLDQLRHVRAALTTLVTNAHGRWQAQTSALSAALNTLGTAVSSLGASPGVSTVTGVVSALGQVNTAAQNLLAAVNTDCPSASPSSSA